MFFKTDLMSKIRNPYIVCENRSTNKKMHDIITDEHLFFITFSQHSHSLIINHRLNMFLNHKICLCLSTTDIELHESMSQQQDLQVFQNHKNVNS